MLGAIIGDLAGSIYEYLEFQDSMVQIINHRRRMEILKKEKLIDENGFYSDDTILTIAILDAVINNYSYEDKLKEYTLKYYDKINKKDYFQYMFSPNFINWSRGLKEGNSKGNGSAMRVSPVAYLYLMI